MHKNRLFPTGNPMKAIFLIPVICIFLDVITLNAQSVIVAGLGVSMGYADNPATSKDGEMLSGFHGSVSGRFGSKFWYLRPGIEIHKMQLFPHKMLDPFLDEPCMYLLKFPLQIGARLIKTEQFNFRIAGGMQFSYTASIQKNDQDLNSKTITDSQWGALLGAGIDLGPITFDVNFEKGLTELYKGTKYTVDYVIITAGISF